MPPVFRHAWAVAQRIQSAKAKGLSIIIGFSLPLIGLIAPISSVEAHFFVKGGKKCRSISYQWGTDWSSFDIGVRGVGCSQARAWIRRDKGGWWGVPSSWRCVKRVQARGDRWNGIGHTDYRCVSPDGSKKIVWVTS